MAAQERASLAGETRAASEETREASQLACTHLQATLESVNRKLAERTRLMQYREDQWRQEIVDYQVDLDSPCPKLSAILVIIFPTVGH
ncbi:unnamed protein product [Protopolystoma xenopodis]|uniref:Uncharacterized protein n=1 Tax=Protopolystoma xenopodis TaxID=117903 RepID=A0A448XPH5_9PLAT|nr:unnamed protein product [Protopolystoma xenopodis]